MEIAIVSDTHMPARGRRLPYACIARMRRADLIVHAGDLASLHVLGELQTYGEVVAVQGNVDDAAVKAALPLSAVVHAGDHRIAVIHDAGAARGRLQRLRRRFEDVDAVVFGHSHMPLHEADEQGFQIFNPGSPTERRRAPRHTMGIAHVRSGRLAFELIELD